MVENFNPAVFYLNAQNPKLVPALGQGYSNGYTTPVQTPADVLNNNHRVAATCTGTLTTDPTDGDILTLTVTNPVLPNGSLAIVLSASSDTVTTMAAKLASALTASPVAMAYNVYGASSGTAAFVVNELGPVGNSTTLSFHSTGSTTCMFTNSGALSGGTGPVIPFANFSFAEGPVVFRMIKDNPQTLPDIFVADMVNAGQPIY